MGIDLSERTLSGNPYRACHSAWKLAWKFVSEWLKIGQSPGACHSCSRDSHLSRETYTPLGWNDSGGQTLLVQGPSRPPSLSQTFPQDTHRGAKPAKNWPWKPCYLTLKCTCYISSVWVSPPTVKYTIWSCGGYKYPIHNRFIHIWGVHNFISLLFS